MTPDQWRLDETRGWLDRARSDLRAAKLLIAGKAYAEALFHCQQAAEKALKGFLTFHQKPFRKTHVLGDLSQECLAIDGSLRAALDQTDSLTQYAWRFRYPPGVPYEPEAPEAGDALRKAEIALREIEHRLPQPG
jgi:HEPN domain-containing protein